ncbi:MAG: CHAT domain-containing protein, partial [Planctomycetota bacterium]
LAGGEPGDDEAAYALAGRARAAALTALLERNRLRPPPQLSGDPLVDSLKERLNLIYNRMICSAGLAAPRSARRVEGLLAEARGVEEQITGRLRRSDERAVAPRGAAAGAEKPSELGRGLEPGATLVEYHAVEGRLVAFVRAGDRLEVVKGLPSLEAVQDAVLRMRFHMERPVHSSAAGGSSARGAPMAAGDRGIQASLRRLHEMVFEPLEEALGAGPIDIVPSGALHGVPFHALHDGRQFLLDRHELSILPYREFLSWRPPRRRDGGTLVAFGLGAAEIPAVRRELGAIGKAFSAMELRIDSDATTAEFRRLAAGASLLHVASHAIFRRDNPMYSLLRLHDGWIAAWELARMAIPARIAILSACETGRVRTDAGDEILGLARGLLAAGVPTLILSLWRVDDAAASLLMGALYRGLASGLPARSALHLAMREVRRSHPHPCHWAPFTLLGQPLARVEPRR